MKSAPESAKIATANKLSPKGYTGKGPLYLLQPNQIDFDLWDACVAQSKEVIIYACSWYLNAVCQKWWAIVEIQDKKYVSVMPLPVKEVLGFKKIYQPFFTQQLGLFTTLESAQTQLEPYLQLISENFKTVYLQLNSQNSLPDLPCFYLSNRINYELNLNPGYETLYRGYAENQKRNIKKGKGLFVKSATSMQPLIQLFKENKGPEVPELKPIDYEALQNLYTELEQRHHAIVVEAYSETELVAGALLTIYQHRIIYLFGASSETGKNSGAIAALLDSVIQKYAGTAYIFDFEGSTIPGLAKFYANFGAKPITYPAIKSKHIPWYLKWLRP